MVISDTHEHCLDGTEMPEVDILINTGDLTNFGQLGALRESVIMMGTIKAELRLVIAGNHDLSLDKVNSIENMNAEQYAEYHRSALEIMKGPLAQENGVTYLEEGTYTFTLKNGAKFKVYASPYVPGTPNWAFTYGRGTNRFSATNGFGGTNRSLSTSRFRAANRFRAMHQLRGTSQFRARRSNRRRGPANPIPLDAHIVMTHGPPYTILDSVPLDYVGCPKLLAAIYKVKPLMHCFGHVHEQYGAWIVTWGRRAEDGGGWILFPEPDKKANEYPDTNKWPIRAGEQTLMINAAIMRKTDMGLEPLNKPFIVSLDLPRG